MTDENWRHMLKRILRTTAERQRIAEELQISPVTVTRWINDESTPRIYNVRLLLQALPEEHQPEMRRLLTMEFGDAVGKEDRKPLRPPRLEIPLGFYEKIVDTIAIELDSYRGWIIINMVLRLAIELLDPQKLGMAVSLVLCNLPREGQAVRTLRERQGLGTKPWEQELDRRPIFLGADSLAGAAAKRGRILTIQDRTDGRNTFPAQWYEHEESAVAAPILKAGRRTVGSLLVSSTQRNYFTEERLSLIERLAQILTLAFEPEEFYEFKRLQLVCIPMYEEQKPVIYDYRDRVATKMINLKIDVLAADREVWHDIEDEIIALPLHYPELDREDRHMQKQQTAEP